MTRYQSGFGNHFATEAVPGALPLAQNSPQRPAFGLYTEQISGTAFTAPRHENRRSWLYRLRPSAGHPPFTFLRALVDRDVPPCPPNRMRWAPRAMPDHSIDWLASLEPVLSSGDAATFTGCALYRYACNTDMNATTLFNADGEWLIIPELGRLVLLTEMGRIALEPHEVAVIPRGVRFRVLLPDGSARGYVAENHGAHFRLPELGPIGSNGLANSRDFETPVAAFEDVEAPHTLIQKYGGALWQTNLAASPLDVVAWHGNLAPYKYDLHKFNAIGTVSFDHPDPSIFTVLTSPSAAPGTANADFVIFPPRWMVAEHSFRPPWFHRNIMSEAMGLISGAYDAKADGFMPGALSLHNMMGAHGPDVESWRTASEATLAPHKIEATMAFMIESALPFCPSRAALQSAEPDYDRAWAAFPKAELP